MINTKFQLLSASVSDRGLSNKRPQNEDSVLEIGEKGIFAVADGVGGEQAGEIASQMAVEILAEAFANKPAGSDAEDVMRHAIGRANEAIYQMSSELPQLSRMATTLVALHVDGDTATIGHVGDSRAYRLMNGVLTQETNDHSIVAEEVRAGRMTPEEASHHPSRNIISRALGAEPSVEPDIKMLLVEPGTSFLLCSDGITRHIDDSEIRQYLAEVKDPKDACTRFKRLCYERGAEDNLTAVVVQIPHNPDEDGLSGNMNMPYGFEEEDTVATARPKPAERIDLPVEPPLDDSLLVSAPPTPVGSKQDEQNSTQPIEKGASSEILNALPVNNITGSTEAFERQGPLSVPRHSSPRIRDKESITRDSPRRNVDAVLPLLTLLVGLGLGFMSYYYWQQANPPQPQQAQPSVPALPAKSNNQPVSSFEETRRIVDRDPTAYLNARIGDPRDAADFYLLGRAYLLTGKIWEAKRAFTEAKAKLGEADTADQKTLASDLALGMAIVNSVSAPGLLEKELQVNGSNLSEAATTSGK